MGTRASKYPGVPTDGYPSYETVCNLYRRTIIRRAIPWHSVCPIAFIEESELPMLHTSGSVTALGRPFDPFVALLQRSRVAERSNKPSWRLHLGEPKSLLRTANRTGFDGIVDRVPVDAPWNIKGDILEYPCISMGTPTLYKSSTPPCLDQ